MAGREITASAVRNDILYIVATILRRTAAALPLDLPLVDRRIGAGEVEAGEIASSVEDWFDVGLEDEEGLSIEGMARLVARSLTEQGREPPSGAEREEAKARFDAACRGAEPDPDRIVGFCGKKRRPE